MVRIKEIMRKYVITVSSNTTISEAAKTMTNNRIGSVMITKNGKPDSIVTADDIVTYVAKGINTKRTKISDLPKKTLITASPNENVLRIVRRMIKNGIKRLPVIEKGKLVGIVSDKEILLTAPEMIDVLSERLRARVSPANIMTRMDQEISGLCERCESYSDDLKLIGGQWLCEDCRG